MRVKEGMSLCNGQVLVESEVKKKRKPQAGIVLFSLFCILQKKKNTFPFLKVIHACPFNFLMQWYHMTMLTISKLWGMGSTPFPTYIPSKIDVLLDIESKTFYPLKADT